MIKIIRPEIHLTNIPTNAYSTIENAARTCYQSSENKENTTKFLQKLLYLNHLTAFEFVDITVSITCDRGISHELVRHRLASYCQESTRYCNYKDKDIEFIQPWWLDDAYGGTYKTKPEEWEFSDNPVHVFLRACFDSAENYKDQIKYGKQTPQAARAVLINALKTQIVMKANFREWLHIFKLRLNPAAHPDMRRIMKMIYIAVNSRWPVIFNLNTTS